MNTQPPPREIEIEKRLLSSILLYPEYREKALSLLSVDDFYITAHQIVFEKCRELEQSGNSVDIETVWAESNDEQRKSIGSVANLAALTDAPVTTDINHHVAILKDRKARRRTIELANSIYKRCHQKNSDLNKIENDAQLIINEINNSNRGNESSIGQGILNLNDFTSMKLAEKRVFLDPWITEQSITLISGWRGVGKSWLGLSIIDAISKGKSFGPWTTETSVPCLYLDGEMAAQDMQYRAKELEMGNGSKSPVFIYSDAYSSQLGLPRTNLLDDKWQESMKGFLISNGIKLWVADNLGSLAPGINENVKQDYDPINEFLLSLRFAGVSTILLHHVGKEGDQRGTSAREDNIDTSIILKQPSDYGAEDGCRFIIKFKKNRVVSGDQFLLADLEFKYERGQWSFDSIKNKTKNEILKLLDQGNKQKDVAELLDVAKSYVSQTRKKAILDGYLTDDNKLTSAGLVEI
jgi:putative DNA primase/helicase